MERGFNMNQKDELIHCFEGVGVFYDGWCNNVQNYLTENLDDMSIQTLLHYDGAPKDLWVIGQLCTEALNTGGFNGNYIEVEADPVKVNNYLHQFYQNHDSVEKYYDYVPDRITKM